MYVIKSRVDKMPLWLVFLYLNVEKSKTLEQGMNFFHEIMKSFMSSTVNMWDITVMHFYFWSLLLCLKSFIWMFSLQLLVISTSIKCRLKEAGWSTYYQLWNPQCSWGSNVSDLRGKPLPTNSHPHKFVYNHLFNIY